MVFPEDNHPIDRPASEAEHWLAIADWIDVHCCSLQTTGTIPKGSC
jgi:hypothetical protein